MNDTTNLPPLPEAMREALYAARSFVRNGIALGYIRMPDPDTPDPAHETLPKIEAAIAALAQSAQAPAQPAGEVRASPTCACNRPSWWCVSHKCSDPYEAPTQPAPSVEALLFAADALDASAVVFDDIASHDDQHRYVSSEAASSARRSAAVVRAAVEALARGATK